MIYISSHLQFSKQKLNYEWCCNRVKEHNYLRYVILFLFHFSFDKLERFSCNYLVGCDDHIITSQARKISFEATLASHITKPSLVIIQYYKGHLEAFVSGCYWNNQPSMLKKPPELSPTATNCIFQNGRSMVFTCGFIFMAKSSRFVKRVGPTFLTNQTSEFALWKQYHKPKSVHKFLVCLSLLVY